MTAPPTSGVAPVVISGSKRSWRLALGLNGRKESLRPTGRSLVYFDFYGLVKGSDLTGIDWLEEEEERTGDPPPHTFAKPLAEAALKAAGIGFTELVWAPDAGPDELGTGWFLEGAERGYNYWIAAPEPEGTDS